MTQQLFEQAAYLLKADKPEAADRVIGEAVQHDANPAGLLYHWGNMLAHTGHFEQAISAYDRALAIVPNSPELLLNRGNALFELRRYEEALANYQSALIRAPANPLLWNNRGNALVELQRNDEAVESFSKALAIDSRHTGARIGRSALLADAGHNEDALRDLESVTEESAELHYRRGMLLLHLKRGDDAINAFSRAIALEPGDAQSHIGHAVALSAMTRHDEALRAVDTALRLAPGNPVAWNSRANILLRLKRYEDALNSTDRILQLDSASAAAWHNRGAALFGMKQFKEALAAYEKALAMDARSARTWNNSAVTLMSLGRNDAALKNFTRALEINSRDPEIWCARAKALANAGRFAEAAADCDRALALDCENVAAQRLAIHARLRACDWSRRIADETAVCDGLAAGTRLIDPLDCLAMLDSAAQNLAAAQLWTAEEFPPVPPPVSAATRVTHQRIRIGYMSTDFREHVMGSLMAAVFEHHDKTGFETIGLSLAAADRSTTQARIAAALGRIVDLHETSDAAAADLVRDMQLDILVDLNGHTGDARTGILARRPAPLQVNFLGYPGTMGAPYIDYLIADPVIIPQSQHGFFSEQIIRLPDCYQPNDRRRKPAEAIPSRASAGLPEDGFVFCSFNNNFKITPGTFDIWMRLLRGVAGSVLWLLEDNRQAAANLRREAEQRGISGQRLVFAQRVPQPAHLARHALADLFLDTRPYNAHTTATDAVWMGLPVVTCPGNSFQSRVAASILTAAGVAELIAPSLEDYEALALGLARDPHRLSRIGMRLEENRDTCAVFDIVRFTRNLEHAYTTICNGRACRALRGHS
ncbi:MAG TPA: tetratricopeptide repeat protein [Micropepsaceae bacterium]|nr:tetratricopeptide repeat protein [Micropepsaceae bacterium]